MTPVTLYTVREFKLPVSGQNEGTQVMQSHYEHIANPLPIIRYGYGACSAWGCNCPAFMGNGNLCANCGHNYSFHW